MCLRLLKRLFGRCQSTSNGLPARMSVPEEVRDKDHELRNQLTRAQAINRAAQRNLWAIEELVQKMQTQRGEPG